jgi:hypothetical protein
MLTQAFPVAVPYRRASMTRLDADLIVLVMTDVACRMALLALRCGR